MSAPSLLSEVVWPVLVSIPIEEKRRAPGTRLSSVLRVRGDQSVPDLLEHRIHLRAGLGNGHNADHRDQRHEQGVFEQVLPFVVPQKVTNATDQLHPSSS